MHAPSKITGQKYEPLRVIPKSAGNQRPVSVKLAFGHSDKERSGGRQEYSILSV